MKDFFKTSGAVTMGVIVAVIFFCCLCFGVAIFSVASSGDLQNEVSVSDANRDGNDTSDNSTDSNSGTYTIDQTVTVDGKQITINSAADYSVSDEFLLPEAGNKYYAINITVENTSDEQISYNFLNYKLVDANGNSFPTGFTTNEPEFTSGELQSGRRASGNLTFEIPEDLNSADLEFIYEPFDFSGTQVVWSLAQ